VLRCDAKGNVSVDALSRAKRDLYEAQRERSSLGATRKNELGNSTLFNFNRRARGASIPFGPELDETLEELTRLTETTRRSSVTRGSAGLLGRRRRRRSPRASSLARSVTYPSVSPMTMRGRHSETPSNRRASGARSGRSVGTGVIRRLGVERARGSSHGSAKRWRGNTARCRTH